MESLDPLPDLPAIDLTFPSTPLTLSAVSFAKNHTSINTVNHCLRSAYWALIIAKKHPDFIGKTLNLDIVIFSIVMHDMGWATTKSLLSEHKRFEVDGADIARAYLEERAHQTEPKRKDEHKWDKHHIQLVWDAIALHTTPSIANYKEPEVSLTQMGIMADFFGSNFPGGLITLDEYNAVAALYPRVGFKDDLIQIMCGLCRDKASTTFDNFVGEFGLRFGVDGYGMDKDKYEKKWEENRLLPKLIAGLESLE